MGKTIVIRIPLERLLRDGQETFVIQLDTRAGSVEGVEEQETETTLEQGEEKETSNSFFAFMETIIAQLKADGKARTSEAYRAAMISLGKYLKGNELDINMMTSQLMEGYEAWLFSNEVKPNSSSFYMRILRAVYNRAVRKGLVGDQKPFERVYTGNARTVKRAVDIETIRRLEGMKPESATACYARDMFLFSFYTRGMSFVDMAYLLKSDLHDGLLTYRRRKTGQQLTIKWEQPMQHLLDQHPSANDKYLLPIIKRCNAKERSQYRHQQRIINEELHTLSKQLGLTRPLTMYVARHSWASIAHDLEAPMSIISQGMGHDSEQTTQIYLKEMDNGKIDALNRRILSLATQAEDPILEETTGRLL